MDDSCDWIQSFKDNDSDVTENSVQNVVQLIKSNQLSVEKVVTDLCPFLTDSEPKERSKGVNILSHILNSLPKDFLNPKEVQHLIDFYCNRLKDHYSVIPNVLSGLLAITDCFNFPKELSQNIFNGLVRELTVQQLPIAQRFLVFQLLTKLFQRFTNELKTIRSEFIYGFIQLIEAERDPRCLLLVFKLTDSVVKAIELEPFTEDVFEVISCYFPILFSPPPNDEYGITKEDLSEALHQCFNCSAFAEYLFVLVLEKLESELMIAKIDSFVVIQNVCPHYGYENIKEYIPQLWTAIRVETLKPKVMSNDITNHALSALTAISDTMVSNESHINGFIELIWTDISNAFNKPELDLMEAAVDIVLATVSTNGYAFNKFISKLMPILLKQFTFGQKESIRVMIVDSIHAIIKHSINCKQNDFKLTNSESLFTLLTSLSIADTESDGLRESVVSCLQQLIQTIDMNVNHSKIITKVLNELINNCFNSEKLLQNSYSLMESMAKLNPLLIQSFIKSLIDNFDPDYSTEANRKRLNCTFSAFVFCSFDLTSFELIVNQLVEEIKSNSYYIDDNQRNYSTELPKFLLELITKQRNIDFNTKSNDILYNKCLDPLIQHCIHVSICTDNKSGTSVNKKLMDSLFVVIGKGVSKLDPQFSQQLFDKLTKFSILGKVDSLLPVVPPTCFCTYVMGPQFLDTLNETQAFIVFGLIETLLSNLKYKSISKDLIELLDKLLVFSVNNNEYKNTNICYSTAKSIGVLVNRFDDKNEELNEKLKQLLTLFEERLEDNEVLDENKSLIINVLIWMTKGLVIGGHSVRKAFIESILRLIENQNKFIRKEVSKAFEVIHSSDDSCLTLDNNGKVRILYHQSFYYETFGSLLYGYLKYKNESSDIKQDFLTALLTQLNYIPKPVFCNELKRLLPMLLDAISGDDGLHSNQTAALDAITQIMIDKNEQILDPSLKTTVNNCVNLSVNSPYLKVRGSALNCLAQIANTFDETILNHLRDEVVRSLRKTLNDKKRVVRKSAVRARCKWILIGQPGK